MGLLADVLANIRRGDSTSATLVRIPDNHRPGAPSPPVLIPDEHYFTVCVESMRLDYNQHWFTTWEPMVTTVTEFQRGDQACSIPGLLGPALFTHKGLTAPGTAALGGTRVADTQPYVGGAFATTMVLCRLPRDNYVRELLTVVERTAGAVDVTGTVGPALKVAGAVVSGIETLLGIDGATAVLGAHLELDPDAGRPLGPGWYAVVADSNGKQLPPDELWIRDGRLTYGPDASTGEPVQGRDYIVFSISATETRSDAKNLPWLRAAWSRVERWSFSNRELDWELAKAHLVYLREELRGSLDLTRAHADKLFTDIRSAARDLHEDALAMAQLGAADTEPDSDHRAELRDELAEILAGG